MNILKNNKILIMFLVLFFIISIISIYSASIYISPSLGKLYYKQIYWYIFGFLIIILLLKIKLSTLYKYSPLFYILNIILLIGLFFTKEVNGSHAWYNLFGIINFQPSEFMKLALILLLPTITYKFYKKEKVISTKKELELILILFIIVLIPSILTFLEPDTGSVIIYFVIYFSILFTSGINKKWIILFISLLVIFLTMFLSLYFLKQELFVNIFGSSFFYRMDRIINWNNKSGMQLTNSLIAISSSGILGHGFNNTPVYFPEAGTDFIFTVFSSNFGLIGSLFLIIILLIFNLYLIKIAKEVSSLKDKYTIIGITSVILFQDIQNIGMVLGLFPITGITLPFISYGGSSLLSYMFLIGIIINIKENEKKKKAPSLNY